MPFWNAQKGKIIAMIKQLGPPSIYMTLNPPSPLEHPEFFIECGLYASVDEVRQHTSQFLTKLAASRPVEYANFMYRRVHDLLKWIQHEEIFPDLLDWVIVTEEQVRHWRFSVVVSGSLVVCVCCLFDRSLMRLVCVCVWLCFCVFVCVVRAGARLASLAHGAVGVRRTRLLQNG
jgi:hypothetical protein